MTLRRPLQRRALLWIGAVLVLVGAPTPASGAPTPTATRFGIFYIGAGNVQVATEVGAHYQRMSSSTTQSVASIQARAQQITSAGQSIVLEVTGTDGGSLDQFDASTYGQRLGQILDAVHPSLLVIENEENGTTFNSFTAAQYVAELRAAIPVASDRHVPIADGGITITGLSLAYWDHLWATTQYAEADRFARAVFTDERQGASEILADIPNSQNPSAPILAHLDEKRNLLAKTQALISAFRALSLDYVNFHWYQADAADMTTAVLYLEQATGHRTVTNEMGQLDGQASTMTSLLDATRHLGLPFVIWMSSQGKGGNCGITLPDHSLDACGLTLKSYFAANG